jgi:hypothetical protein
MSAAHIHEEAEVLLCMTTSWYTAEAACIPGAAGFFTEGGIENIALP